MTMLRFVLLLAAGACTGALHAAPPEAPARAGAPASGGAVPASRLDALRGGFELPGGLRASFGLVRTVSVDGDVVAGTRVHVADIGRMTVDDANALAAATAPLAIRNDASGITVTRDGPRAGLVLQNALDNQALRSVTTLDISVDTLGLYKTLNANGALMDALNLNSGR